ncbi:MAG: MFS transporter [Dehalococcoidales bacterium]|nr:MFS transporter [Dehalococcoidales bacterium]
MNELKQPQASKVLPVISVVTFLGFIDTFLLIPIIALYASELGASIGIVGLIIGLYSITNTPANIFVGRLVDRVGYRLPLVAGLIGDAVSMFLYTLCRVPFHLALVRVLHGITGGMVGPSTMSAIAHHGGETRRGRLMAVYGMSLAAATLVGYGLSGFIASRLGYKVVFWLGGGLLVIGAALGLWLPGSGRRDTTEIQTPPGEGWRRVKDLLRRRGLTSSYCTIFAQYFSFGGVVTLLPLYLKNLGMEAFHVGILLAAFAVMFIILQMPMGILSDRIGRAGLTAAGLALGIVALVLLPWMTAFPLLIVVMALYGAAYGMIFPSVSATVADHTAAEERGLGTGIFHALLTAGVAIGAPVMGWAASVVGVERGLILSAGVMVLALAVTMVVRNSIRIDRTKSAE